MAKFSFLKRPRWIAGIALAILGVVVFTSFGFWQLRRLDEQRTINAQIIARSLGAALPIGELPSDITEARYQLVQLAGEYVVDQELILQARSLGGLSGHHVITPLRLEAGQIVLIERGWVPIDVEGPPAVGFEPVSTTVTLTGIVLEAPRPSSLGPQDPTSGVLARIGRIDLERLQQQFDEPLAPFYVRLVSQDPAQPNEEPRIVPLPEIDDGPHMAYAVQWFIFAGVVVVGFPVLVRRVAVKPTAKRRSDDLRR